MLKGKLCAVATRIRDEENKVAAGNSVGARVSCRRGKLPLLFDCVRAAACSFSTKRE